jgi:glucosamine--fructose-6-phosphate aminotransferase (isomerizing)
VALVNHRDKRLKSLAQDLIAVPEVDEIFSPIVNAAALQLFAYHVAVERGCDVDQPRNLAKSVTVE